MHGVPASSYVEVACNEKGLHGFSVEKLSAMGTPRRVVQPRDYEVFERFIGVVDGGSIGPAADLALELRRHLHGEPWTTVSGRLQLAAADGQLGDELRATVFLFEGRLADTESQRIPWTQITPGEHGRFTVRVPAGRPYALEVKAFGNTVVAREVAVDDSPVDIGTLEVPPAAQLHLSVMIDGSPANAWIFLHPADEETRQAVTGRMMGTGVRYAAAGPFRSLARQTVTVEPASSLSILLALARLPLRPTGPWWRICMWRDVDFNDDEVLDEKDEKDWPSKPDCDISVVGPLKNPSPTTDRNHPRYHFEAVQHIAAASLFKTTHGFPAAFTNPFLLELDGVDGFRGPQQ